MKKFHKSMNFNVYTVFDTVSKSYKGLFYHYTDEEMIRTSIPIILADLPLRDVEVYQIGIFDIENGIIQSSSRKKVNLNKYPFPHSALSSKGDDLSLEELDKGIKEHKAQIIASLSPDSENKEVVNG